mgnify:CR=1 FL=1
MLDRGGGVPWVLQPVTLTRTRGLNQSRWTAASSPCTVTLRTFVFLHRTGPWRRIWSRPYLWTGRGRSILTFPAHPHQGPK